MTKKVNEENVNRTKKILKTLCNYLNVDSYRGLARYLKIKPTTVYGWRRNGKIADTGVILAKNPEINPLWLETGQGSITRELIGGTAEKTADFGVYKKKKDDKEELQEIIKANFIMQCPGYFAELFDFVGEYYGTDKEGVDRFMEDLHNGFANYRDYIREKKAARENIQTEEQDNLIANQK